jgi:ribosome maturation factor RimP
MKGNPKLTDLVRNVVEPMGYELVGCELVPQGKGSSIFRVYIDHEEGITLDDCSAVSHQLSGVLDVEDPIKGNYNLEISSPGLDRPLFEAEHFDRFAGHRVSVKMQMAVLGRKNFKGLLLSRESDDIQVEVDGEVYDLPINQIDQARLIPDF